MGHETYAPTEAAGPSSGNRADHLPPRAIRDPRERAERDLNAAHRERQALHLRLQGYDFDTIASECGYSDRSAAYKAYKRALGRIPRQGIEEARAHMIEGLNLVRSQLWASIVSGDARAAQAWVQTYEREAKLMGYDTPPPKSDEGGAPKVVIRSYGSADSPVNTDLL